MQINNHKLFTAEIKQQQARHDKDILRNVVLLQYYFNTREWERESNSTHDSMVQETILKLAISYDAYHMFNPAVLSLCVLSNCDKVHISVGGLVAFDRHTGTDVCIKVKGFTK